MARTQSRHAAAPAHAPYVSPFLAAALGLGALLTPLVGAATTITVDGTPGGAGVVLVAADGQCSLIEAIQAANSSAAVDTCPAGSKGAEDPDTLVLPANATFTVDDTTTPVPYNNKIGVSGLPVISTDMIIRGNGSTVRRGAGSANFRLFLVNAAGNLTLDSLNLRNGNVSNQGGAIAVRGGTAALVDLTVEGNGCTADGCDGGGIFAQDAKLRLTRVAVLGNTSKDAGGGIRIVRPVNVVIEHSTIAGNTSVANGGGISINELPDGALAAIRYSTIANNTKHGLYVNGVTADTVSVEENIFFNNGIKDCQSTVQIASNGKANVAPIDNRGALCPPVTLAANLATKLGALAFNGGPTKTLALLPGADAIDLGSSACTADPERDQRGVLQNVDGQNSELSTDPDARCDLGAYESTNVYDYGDAPAPYPTVLGVNGAELAAGGALHELAIRNDGSPAEGVVYLGACVDGDAAPTSPSADAKSDDSDTGAKVIGTCATAGDDEDGVAIPKLIAGLKRGLKIITPEGQSAVLDGWIDFNNDGDWDDAGEKVVDHRATHGGTEKLVLKVPLDATIGATYARFRITPAGLDSPAGFAGNGEVEDYRVSIVPIDTTPLRFSFAKVTGAAAGTLVTSEFVTIKGINAPTPVSISGAASATYQIGNGEFTNVAGTIRKGQQIRLQVRAANKPGEERRVMLTIGGRTTTWVVVTAGP